MRLTKVGFVAWLRSKKPEDKVGISQNSTRCPLGRYLLFATRRVCHVTSRYWLNSDSKSHPNPTWAYSFVNAVDGAKRGITAKRALELLKERRY